MTTKFSEVDWKLIEKDWKKEISINNIKIKYYSKDKESFCKFFQLNSFYMKDFKSKIDYEVFIEILNNLERQNIVDFDRVYKNSTISKNRKWSYLKKTFSKFCKIWILFEIEDWKYKLNEKIAYKWDKHRQAILKQYYFDSKKD